MTLSAIRLGFVGAGRMAQAIGQGIAGKTDVSPAAACFFDPNDIAAAEFVNCHPGAQRSPSLANLARDCNFLVLAVKPQIMRHVLGELRPAVDRGHLIVSVAAGVTLTTLGSCLETNRLIRVMPNTPCLIGQGISAMAFDAGVTESDRILTERMFGLIGKVVIVPEESMDAVTGLSGSGPAYVFTFIEALIQGGVAVGLPEHVAAQLAIQTVRGATELLIESGKSPDELRHNVTSPGGTTLAGLNALEQGKFADTVKNAVRAATQRATQMAGMAAAN